MKKGLNVTLMTVAIAVMAFQAMALAPVISDIRSPIVGGVPGATSATPYVFTDAFNIVEKATDDSTTSVNIRWSYYYAGPEIYRINNVDRVALTDAAINNPGAARINGATTDPGDVDANPATITIRNVKYAPVVGSPVAPTGSGIIDVTLVTLFASDGSTYTLQENGEVYFYTDTGGQSRLSGSVVPWTPEGIGHQTAFPTQGTSVWTWSPPSGTVTSSTQAGTAVCIETAALGVNVASWISSWGTISVAKNTVYRIRARIQGTQTSAETTQFFDFVLGNFDGSTQGLNLFGADFMFFDNTGGANAPLYKPSTNGTTYEMYWAPSCVNNANYNASTVWNTSNAENRKMLLAFRVLDINNFTALTADNDFGRLCLNDFTVDALPTSKMSLQQVWASPTTLTASNFHAASIFGAVTYETDKIRMSQQNVGGNNSATLDFGGAFPGDGTIDYGNMSSLSDNYPVPWEANTLYQIGYSYSAVDSGSAAAPFDALWVGMDCPSNEMIVISYVTSQEGLAAMPKTGTPQEYVAFIYGHTVTTSGVPEFAFFRPRSEWANSPSIIESANSGSMYLHSARVSKVTFTP